MIKKLIFILFTVFLSSCGYDNSRQENQIFFEQATDTTNTLSEGFTFKIKKIEQFFVKRDLRKYDCSDIEKYFYHNGTKVNLKGLKEIDSTICNQVFGNYENDNRTICNSYLFSIDKPIHNFHPITVIQFGIAERPIIMVLFNKEGDIVNSLEVANFYGETGGCLSSRFLNDSMLIQDYELKEYGEDPISKKAIWEIEYVTKEVTITSKGEIIEKEIIRRKKTDSED